MTNDFKIIDGLLLDIECVNKKGEKVYPSQKIGNGRYSVSVSGRSDDYHDQSLDELIDLFARGVFEKGAQLRMSPKSRKTSNGMAPNKGVISESFLKAVQQRRDPGKSMQSLESPAALIPDPPIRRSRIMSIEALMNQLDRQSEVGKAGERIAIEDELKRLSSIGCQDPDRHVKHVAETDVGRGYDIESTWPGHERCIEVKTSTRADNDIYMSENERSVLKTLGRKAWLYRVELDAGDKGEVVSHINDPIAVIPDESFSTAVWRIRLA